MLYATSLRQLAGLVGVSSSWLMEWRGRGCPIAKGPQGYPVEPVRKWTAARKLPVAQGEERPRGGDAGRLLKAQADEREAKAELAALKLKIERGDYLARERVDELTVARIHAVKRGLLSHARSLPPLLQGLDMRAMETVIEDRVRGVLRKFSEQ